MVFYVSQNYDPQHMYVEKEVLVKQHGKSKWQHSSLVRDEVSYRDFLPIDT